MGAGFEVYTSGGFTMSTPNARCLKFLGVVAVSSASNPSGSITDSRFLLGRKPDAWFIASGLYEYSPEIVITGSTLSWSNPSGQFWIGRIIYGFW